MNEGRSWDLLDVSLEKAAEVIKLRLSGWSDRGLEFADIVVKEADSSVAFVIAALARDEEGQKASSKVEFLLGTKLTVIQTELLASNG